MNSANRLFFFLFILGLYFFSHGSCKAFLKNLEVKNLENTPDKSEINVNNTDVVSNESYYYSLNELGIISDHLNQPTRSLSNPEMISFAEISSEIDEAEIVTNNFFRNIFFDVKSYMNTPYGICIFVILLLVFMIIILKIFLASNILKVQEIQVPTNILNGNIKKSSISEDISSKTNFLSALQDEKSCTFQTANSHLKRSIHSEFKSTDTIIKFLDKDKQKLNLAKYPKKLSSEKNFNQFDPQNENFHDFSQDCEEEVDILIRNIDMEDLLMNENVTSENAKNIILNQDFNVKKDRSFSESNENDLYYDLDDNYFSDCNLSEITKYKN